MKNIFKPGSDSRLLTNDSKQLAPTCPSLNKAYATYPDYFANKILL